MLPSFYNFLCGDCWVATNDVLGSFNASDDETTQRLENSFSGTFCFPVSLLRSEYSLFLVFVSICRHF